MSETEQLPPGTGEQFERCEQCNAPVDREQRYCVNCGAHRRHVPDPAAKYMSRSTAHRGPRSTAGPAGTAVARRRRRSLTDISLLGALALALIPVAAAVGVLIGRSSNNQDARLYHALENQQAQTTTTLVNSSAAASSGSAATGTSSPSTTTSKKKAKTSSTKQKTSATKSAKSSSSSSSNSNSNGNVTQVTGSKVTASQQSQGSAEAKKIQNSTGQSYVQGANNLPSSVVVGGS